MGIVAHPGWQDAAGWGGYLQLEAGGAGAYIGYLPQDIELFEGSISENIARFGEVDSKEVVRAATMRGCMR